MAWYSDGSTTWRRRMAISVIDSAGGSPGSYDVSLELAAQHAEFWANVQTDGFDIIVTQSDGMTEIAHARGSWNYAGKTAQIDIDNAGLNRGSSKPRIHLLWIYFDTADTVAGDPATPFTPSSALPARCWPGRIRGALVIPPALPGDSQPRMIQQKSADDENEIVISIAHLLDGASTEINGSAAYDEPSWVEVSGETGTVSTSLWNTNYTRYDLSGRFVRSILKGGTTATDYTQWCKVGISNPDDPVDGSNEPRKVYDQRIIVKIKTTLET